MGYFLDALRAMKTTMANVFRPVVTVQFPEVVRPRGPRHRVSFALPDDEHGEIACIGCLACERICPSQVITMKSTGKKESPVTGKKRAYVDAFTLDLTACIQCELCIQVCNSDAITMVMEPEVPVFNREDLVLDIDRLRANAKNKTASWGKGVALQEMQEGAKPKPAEKKAAAEKKPAGDTPEKKPAVASADEAKPAVTSADAAKPAVASVDAVKPAVASADEPVAADAKSNAAKSNEATPPVATESSAAPAATPPAEAVAAGKETA